MVVLFSEPQLHCLLYLLCEFRSIIRQEAHEAEQARDDPAKDVVERTAPRKIST